MSWHELSGQVEHRASLLHQVRTAGERFAFQRGRLTVKLRTIRSPLFEGYHDLWLGSNKERRRETERQREVASAM